MTQRFDDEGNAVACTVIELEKNVVTQIKTKEKDGYSAVQLGFEEVKAKDERTVLRRVGKPLFGHYKNAGVSPRKFLGESRVEDSQSYQLGQEVGVEQFTVGGHIDVTATSKGKGYQGVMKLHGFRGIGDGHGAGPVHRHAGSTGHCSTPGRCFKGGKRASQMGNRQVTTQNLEIIHIDEEKGLLVVRGAVPGSRNSVVTVQRAIKIHNKQMSKKG